jgi:signal transduction histidine kinase
MALELHDQVVQDLLFVRRQLASTLADPDPAKIKGARDEIDRIAGYFDTLIFELRPPELEEGNLGQILARCAVNFEKRRDLPVSFQTNGSSDGASLPEEIKLAVYRIFQESLTNACKHAKAEQVEATLDVQRDQVRLAIRDDGVGFEVPRHYGDWIDANRMGVAGMRARVRDLGGKLEVKSQIGQGTQVIVDLPLTSS